MTLGEKIKSLRNENKMTQLKFADYLGVSSRAIIQFEKNDTTPNLNNLRKISELFGVSMDYLVTDKDTFILKASEKYGYSGKKEAEELIYNASTMFAGGSLSEGDKEAVFKVMQEIYFESKEKDNTKD